MITPLIRGYDKHGAGHYLASRGKRIHNGIDFVCNALDEVMAFSGGVVSKIGYPYQPNDMLKGHMRYVEITDKYGLKARYFYVTPHVTFGDTVKAGEVVGVSQGMARVYPGITQHFHFEVMVRKGKYLNPHEYFKMV